MPARVHNNIPPGCEQHTHPRGNPIHNPLMQYQQSSPRNPYRFYQGTLVGSVFHCPVDDVTYLYCAGCNHREYGGRYDARGWVEMDSDYIMEHRGRVECDDTDSYHTIRQCASCGNYCTMYVDANRRCDEPPSGDHYCSSCWEGCDCRDCTYEDDDYDNGCSCDACSGYPEPSYDEPTVCPNCSQTTDNLDLLAEVFVCGCGITALRDEDPDHPIYVRGSNDHGVAVNTLA